MKKVRLPGKFLRLAKRLGLSPRKFAKRTLRHFVAQDYDTITVRRS
jgi:hypothetical protein